MTRGFYSISEQHEFSRLFIRQVSMQGCALCDKLAQTGVTIGGHYRSPSPLVLCFLQKRDTAPYHCI